MTVLRQRSVSPSHVCMVSSPWTQDIDAQDGTGSGCARRRGLPPRTTESRDEFRSSTKMSRTLKKEVLDLNRDLFLLEEELLFPANSQVAFFISMDVGEYFELDSVSLKIDGKEVANYLYTEREVDALMRGGVHRVHMANLKTGDHELIAVFTGKGRIRATTAAARR